MGRWKRDQVKCYGAHELRWWCVVHVACCTVPTQPGSQLQPDPRARHARHLARGQRPEPSGARGVAGAGGGRSSTSEACWMGSGVEGGHVMWRFWAPHSTLCEAGWGWRVGGAEDVRQGTRGVVYGAARSGAGVGDESEKKMRSRGGAVST